MITQEIPTQAITWDSTPTGEFESNVGNYTIVPYLDVTLQAVKFKIIVDLGLKSEDEDAFEEFDSFEEAKLAVQKD